MAVHIDPVCGMEIDDAEATLQSMLEGKSYYFCSQNCKTKFDKNPQQYASQSAGS